MKGGESELLAALGEESSSSEDTSSEDESSRSTAGRALLDAIKDDDAEAIASAVERLLTVLIDEVDDTPGDDIL